MQKMSTRRDFFRQAMALSGGAGIAAALLSSVQRASAIDPAKGSTYLDAEHIVILMQENRSFDHSFGTLRGVRGFNDPRAVTLPDGNPVWLQTNAAGETYAPFRLNIKDTKITWLGGLPHSWRDQQDARNHGDHDRWLDAKPAGAKECAGMPITMGHYEREDLPFYYALADAFTVCDQHFCSSLTGTTPNRLYLWSGTVRDEPRADAFARVRNSDTDYGALAHWTTFPERLEDAGISWRIYQNEVSIDSGLEGERDAWLSNFTDNPIEWFAQYHIGFARGRMEYLKTLPEALPPKIEATKTKLSEAAPGSPEHRDLSRQLREMEAQWKRLPEDLARYTPENFEKLPQRERNLHTKAFTTNIGDPSYRQLAPLRYRDGDVERELEIPKGDILHQFREDVKSGQLPAVSWIVAPENFSDHPGAPWFGAWYVSEVLNILTHDPEVWKKTVCILTYDENDGYFDHVPPFGAPHPGRPETGATSPGVDAALEYVTLDQDRERHNEHEARGGPIGLGFRVPMVVASPWSRGGFACSQVFDHTSVIQLVERVLTHQTGRELKEPNISAWRRTVCGDLSSAFQAGQEEPSAVLPFSSRDTVIEGIHKAKFKKLPGGFHRFTEQEIIEFRRNPQGSPWMSRQEKGIRPSRALPYQLYADGSLSPDRKALEISFEARNEVFGKSSAGAPFHVYTPRKYRRVRVRDYTVAPGDRLSGSWLIDDFEDGVYHVRAAGPNGFLREFAGTAQDPELDVRCQYARRSPSGRALTGDVEVHLTNRSASQKYAFVLEDLAYGTGKRAGTVPPGKKTSVVLNLNKSHQWYDFSVRVQGAESFERRCAGRVETGRSGFSDPAMSGMEA
jgi:phospholipase C